MSRWLHLQRLTACYDAARMQKDFDRWNEHKKAIHASAAPRVFFHVREMWFAHLGMNVGFEQDGRGDEALRPVLVLRKFNNEVMWALPLTLREKPDNPYYARFRYIEFPEESAASMSSSIAILSQLRLLDAKRLRYKIGTADSGDFRIIKERVRRLLA